MQVAFSYDKKKVIQGLRYHFILRQEIRIMIILVNVFAIFSAILFYSKKIRPEPFFLGTLIWLFMMVAVWYVLPYTVYKRTSIFKESFIINFSDKEITLEAEKGYALWQWNQLIKYFESPNFFHLYFNAKSFFLIPKENINETEKHELRLLFSKKINKK